MAPRTPAPLHLAPIEVLAPNNDPIQMEAARQVALALQRARVALWSWLPAEIGVVDVS